MMLLSLRNCLHVLAFVLFVTGTDVAFAQNNDPSAWTRVLMGSGAVRGQKEVTLLIATPFGKQTELESAVTSEGGHVVLAIPEIGYLRVAVPADKVQRVVAKASVDAAAIDGKQHLYDSVTSAPVPPEPAKEKQLKDASTAQRKQFNEAKQASASSDAQRVEFPSSLLQPGSGYDPNAPMQATEWVEKYPAYDGRGVTIAVVEGVADLSNPSLREAKDLQGATIPKIGAILNPEFASAEIPDWAGEVHFSKNPKLRDGTTCPRAVSSAQRVGVWQGTVGWHSQGGTPDFCVSWDSEWKTARMDLDRDGDFADDTPLSPYNETHVYAKVPLGNQYATAYVQYDAKTGRVFIHATAGDHTTMVATAAAGTDLMGTGLGGVAPGARLVFATAGEDWSGLIETFWVVARRSDVDLVTASTGISSYPNDAAPIYNLFLDRISNVTGKPILMAARNHGPVVEQSDAGHQTITVGGYESAATLAALAVDEQHLPEPGAVIDFSSNGPSMSGDIGTDFVTPVLGITGWNWGNNEDRPTAVFVGKTYKLPRGYGLGGGTSVATPRAAGAVALLLSAAKQNNLKVNAAMVKQALMASAKPVDGDGMYRQGAGLVQVEAAWDALQELSKQPRATIHSNSKAISPLYPYWWRGRKTGDSIYLVRGVIAGETKKLPLDVWMDNPTKETSKFNLSLVGDRENFPIPAFIDLSRKREMTITFHSTKSGNYSGLIELRRPGMKYPVAEIPVFVASTADPKELQRGVEITKTVMVEDQQFTVFNLPKHAHHIEAELTAVGSIQPSVSYVIDDQQPRHFPVDTLTGTTQIGYSDIPEIGDATILGVNVNVRSNYPMPCCNGTYTLKLKVTTEQRAETARSRQQIVLQVPPSAEWMKESDLTVRGGNDIVRLEGTCPACKKTDDYELYVFKSFKDPKGAAQQGLWSYWPVFHGSWSDVVPRDNEDSTWKFIVMRRPPGLVNKFTPKR